MSNARTKSNFSIIISIILIFNHIRSKKNSLNENHIFTGVGNSAADISVDLSRVCKEVRHLTHNALLENRGECLL